MAEINGCNLPEDLFYLVEKHVWARPVTDGLVRIGMTSVAAKMSGGKLTAITVRVRNIGKEILQGKSIATVESSKFVGPIPAPISGTLVRANERIETNPNLAVSDPYGEGWIAELQPSNWEVDQASLATGVDGLAAYRAKLEAEGIHCN